MSEENTVVVYDNTIKGKYRSEALSGCAIDMSWNRLSQILHATGELRQAETIKGIVCGEHGIQLYLKSS